MKKVLCAAALVFQILHIQAGDDVVTLFAGLGSAVSAGFSASGFLSQVSSVSLTGAIPMSFVFRSTTISDPNVIPRFMLDVTCAALALSELFKNDKRHSKGYRVLNAGGFGASIYSLLLLAPALPTNFANPLYAARAALDLAQIWLTGRRPGIDIKWK